jgi:hypothetical protein
MSTRCQRCGGVMLANMESRHKGKDDYYAEACMLCGYDNQPTLTLAELRERERNISPFTDAEKKDLPKLGRKAKKGPRPDRTAIIDRDGIYTRFLGAVTQWTSSVTARDIARDLGIPPGCVRACLSRAESQGYIKKGDTKYLFVDDLGHTHGRVWTWERVSPYERQRAS